MVVMWYPLQPYILSEYHKKAHLQIHKLVTIANHIYNSSVGCLLLLKSLLGFSALGSGWIYYVNERLEEHWQ